MKNFFEITKFKISAFVMPLLLPAMLYAEDEPTTRKVTTFANPLKGTETVAQLLAKVLGVLIQIGIPVLVIFIVFAGFQFVTAQGNAKKIEEAKEALKWAIIGGAILLGANILASVLDSTIHSLAS